MGVARNAPIGPHIQAQNAMPRKIDSGWIESTCRPTIGGRQELSLDQRDRHENAGRQQRAEDGRVGHQADHEQQHIHDRRADIGNVVQAERERAPQQRRRQAEQIGHDRW